MGQVVLVKDYQGALHDSKGGKKSEENGTDPTENSRQHQIAGYKHQECRCSQAGARRPKFYGGSKKGFDGILQC